VLSMENPVQVAVLAFFQMGVFSTSVESQRSLAVLSEKALFGCWQR